FDAHEQSARRPARPDVLSPSSDSRSRPGGVHRLQRGWLDFDLQQEIPGRGRKADSPLRAADGRSGPALAAPSSDAVDQVRPRRRPGRGQFGAGDCMTSASDSVSGLPAAEEANVALWIDVESDDTPFIVNGLLEHAAGLGLSDIFFCAEEFYCSVAGRYLGLW